MAETADVLHTQSMELLVARFRIVTVNGVVQLTPPGSGTSVDFGEGITTAAPSAAEGTLVVSDIEAARDELVGRGIEVSDIWHGPPFPVKARQPGPGPARASYGSFVYFNDPDGNTWLVQEVTTRRPGRIDAAETGYLTTWTWRLRFAVPKPPTASTSGAPRGRTSCTGPTKTRTGPPGTPPTWWPSRPGRTCLRDGVARAAEVTAWRLGPAKASLRL